MRLVTTEEMRALERATFDAGTSASALMERAGTAVANAAAEWLVNPRGRTLLVLAGKGNNGGDALIAGRLLAQEHGMVPRIYLASDRGDDPLLAWAREAGVPLAIHQRHQPQARPLREWLRDADVVLDGLLGIGARLPLRGTVREILEACAEVERPGRRQIAVDLPTGVDADTGQADERAFHADLTLSTGPAKPGLFLHPGRACAGRVRPLDIGLAGLAGESEEAPLWRAEAGDVAQLLPPRPDDSHKGTFGKVLVVAGSRRYVGAAYLAGAAAVRVGAGLVTLAVPAAAQAALAGQSVETTYLPLPDDPAAPGALTPGHLGSLLDAARSYDAVALGPGIGDDPATRKLVWLLLENLAQTPESVPVVVDADALNALAAEHEASRPRPAAAGNWVLTPHPGEMGRLAGLSVEEVQADRLRVAREHAGRWDCVVLLKGAPSVVATPDGRAWLSGFGNAALATAGAGDVLTGTIAGLLAQGCAPPAAAVAGSYVHGLAAELWRHRHGAAGLAVSHLAELLPQALHQLRSSAA
jgi:NAD(P)H-hydrate epimerase